MILLRRIFIWLRPKRKTYALTFKESLTRYHLPKNQPKIQIQFLCWFHFSLSFLVYTTYANSSFRACWLASWKWLARTIHLRAAKETNLHVKSLTSNHFSLLVLVRYILKELNNPCRGGYLTPLRGDWLFTVNMSFVKFASCVISTR